MSLKRKSTMRSFVYLTIGLAMLFYALPHMPEVTASLEGVFTLSWTGFAMLIIAANLYYLVGVDRERQHKKNRYRWIQRGLREMRRGYFPQAKKAIKEKERRRYMS